jgi:hypothetical protein
MRGETAYTSFCAVLAPTFQQTTSSDCRCLGAECDRHNANQLLSEHKTICAAVAQSSMFVSYVLCFGLLVCVLDKAETPVKTRQVS